MLRKKQDLRVEERIAITVDAGAPEIREALAEHRTLIAEEPLCVSIEDREPEGDAAAARMI